MTEQTPVVDLSTDTDRIDPAARKLLAEVCHALAALNDPPVYAEFVARVTVEPNQTARFLELDESHSTADLRYRLKAWAELVLMEIRDDARLTSLDPLDRVLRMRHALGVLGL